MANILEVFGVADLYILQELSDDLEEILLSVGYGGKAEDLDYIKGSQGFMKKKYGKLIELLANDVTTNPYTSNSKLGSALASIISAYDKLQGILFLRDRIDEEDIKRIEEDARDSVYEYLIFPEDIELIS